MLERQEADNFEHGRLPVPTDDNYEFTEKPPEWTPPFSASMMVARFKDPTHCQDSTLCLKQFPKRKTRRPIRGDPIDGNTAWGIYLQDFFSIRRLCFAIFLCFVAGLVFGICWAVWKGSIQDGFSVSGFVFAGAVGAAGMVQTLYMSIRD